MKKKDITLSIQNPCGENYDEFIKTPAGGFCLSCQKEVIDFSRMTNQQILDALKNSKSTCGRFREDQIGVIGSRYDTSSNWKFPYIAASFGLFSMLSVTNLFSQNPAKTDVRGNNAEKLEHRGDAKIQTQQKGNPSESLKGEDIPTFGSLKQQQVKLTGRVVDANREPIYGAAIYFEGAKSGAVADVDGRFSIDQPVLVEEELILKITYLGFKPRTIYLSKDTLQNTLDLQDIVLEDNMEVFIMGAFISNQPYHEKKWTPRWVGRKVAMPFRRLYYKLTD
ncbi:MAG: carboxypeptidase-like regulatory domain-containing protein [Flavobacteriales bacterium]|nr:carboxypeptidase-like regulatory domain-containing protein [Flavobacteriales bacterium]